MCSFEGGNSVYRIEQMAPCQKVVSNHMVYNVPGWYEKNFCIGISEYTFNGGTL